MDNNKSKAVEDEKILQLAQQVTTLLQFASLLIPDIDTLEKVYVQSGEIASRVDALAPVILASGGDYDEKRLEAGVRNKRALAIIELVRVIRDTEKERKDFNKSQANKTKLRNELGGILGL